MEDRKRIREMKLEGRYYNEENYEGGEQQGIEEGE